MKVFYLHGMGGSPADWDEIARLVPGRALRVTREENYAATASALAGRIRQEAVSPFVLCGYSMGGRLAIRAATALRGSGLKGLVLLATGFGFPDDKSRAERQEKDAEWATIARDPVKFWELWYRQDLFSTFQELPAGRREIWLESRMSIDIGDLTHQIQALSPAQHENLLPELLRLVEEGISVLYIAGERDKKYEKLASSLERDSGIAVSRLPAGHILPLEAPAEVAEELRKFIAKLEDGKNGKKH